MRTLLLSLKTKNLYCFLSIGLFAVQIVRADFFSNLGDLIMGKADPRIVDIPNFRSTVTTCSSLERARVSALLDLKKDSLKIKQSLREKYAGKVASAIFTQQEDAAVADLSMQGNRMIHTTGELCSLKHGSAEDVKKYNNRCLITNDDGNEEKNEVVACALVEPGDSITINHSEILCAPKAADVARIATDLKKAEDLLVALKLNVDKEPTNLALKEKYNKLNILIETLKHEWSGAATKVTQSNTFLCGNPVKEAQACLLKDPKGVLTELIPVPGSCKKIEDN